MQDWPLTVDKILDHAAINHGTREIISRSRLHSPKPARNADQDRTTHQHLLPSPKLARKKPQGSKAEGSEEPR